MDCSLTNALPKPKTISVNGAVIPREVIAREVQNHPAEKPILAWQAAARALVVRELLLQESRRLGIEAEPLCDPEGRPRPRRRGGHARADRARGRRRRSLTRLRAGDSMSRTAHGSVPETSMRPPIS